MQWSEIVAWRGEERKDYTILVGISFKYGKKNRTVALRWLRIVPRANFGTNRLKLSASATTVSQEIKYRICIF
jgi:hypothetical protein